MAIDKVQFVERVRAARVLTAEHENELANGLARRFGDVKALAKDLIQRGWLTEYQIKRITQGRGDELGLGPYVLLDLIGEGGMGQVFKARHPLMDRVVALKLIRPDRLSSPETVQRFEREIKAAAKLVHPNVVIVHDASQVDDRHFYVMEFIPGTDLAQLVAKEGPLPIAAAADYIRQAALGLQHAHQHGLIHRDIKPGNLLLCRGSDSSGVVKILDLGLARLRPSIAQTTASEELTKEGALMGTPDYMAPEQASS